MPSHPRIDDALVALEAIAPRHLRLGDDPHGLLAGDPDAPLTGITVALDATGAVVRAAARAGHGLVLAHHPLWYHRARTLVASDPFPAPVLVEALRHGIAVACAHTAWDVAPGGVNDVLAKLVGVQDPRPVRITHAEALSQLIVYVPHAHADRVREAIFAAGGGAAGNYDECAFELHGEGSFRPLPGSNPVVGSHMQREVVREVRLETILPTRIASRVVEAARIAHPYETMAHSVHALANTDGPRGLGRIGALPEPRSSTEFLRSLAEALRFDAIRDSGVQVPIRTVAVCGGAGAELMAEAQAAGADVLVTSDVRHHEFVEAMHRNFLLVDAGHAATEDPGTRELARRLKSALPEVEIVLRDPAGAPAAV
ncbi:MAG: Nif3-like dinuclear metal center hexameric protein [Armatimonadota bacterium]